MEGVIVVQHDTAETYLRADGQWTPSISEAEHFKDGQDAHRACMQRKLGPVRLTLHFPDRAPALASCA